MNCSQCSTRARCLFSNLSREGHPEFWQSVRERIVEVGEVVERQGSCDQKVAVVKVGILKGIRHGPIGDKKPIFLIGKGRVVGFTQPFGQPSLYDLEVVTKTRLCEIDFQVVRHLAMHQEPFQLGLYERIAEFLGSMADWSHLLRHESFPARLCGALHLIAREEGSPSFRIPSHAVLADLLGTRRETVVRHMALLVERGLFKKIDRWHGAVTALPCSTLLDEPS